MGAGSVLRMEYLVNSRWAWHKAQEMSGAWLLGLVIYWNLGREIEGFDRSLSIDKIKGESFRINHRHNMSSTWCVVQALNALGQEFCSGNLKSPVEEVDPLGQMILNSDTQKELTFPDLHSSQPQMHRPRISWVPLQHGIHMHQDRNHGTTHPFRFPCI